MNRTINIPSADNAFLEMLAQKMGWTISQINSHTENYKKPDLNTPEKRKKAIELLQSIAGKLPNSHLESMETSKRRVSKNKTLMRIFLDTNILIDLLEARGEFTQNALKVASMVINNGDELLLSDLSV